ncbi:MAG: hypothetical protein ACI8RZ_007979, partial [Myxococcota bacterium]
MPSVTLPSFGDRINASGTVYTIGDHLGSGHFSEVYRCSDEWGN